MIRYTRKHKMLIYVMLLGLIINFRTISSTNATNNNLIEIPTIVQDPNGIGVVLTTDITTLATQSSNVYILIGLSQNSNLNGLYLAGFGMNGTSMLAYKLGNPQDITSLWFNKENTSITNYGSIIYFDTLDYVIAFGKPDNAKGVVLELPDSFDTIKSIIDHLFLVYKIHLLSESSTNTTSTSTTITNTTPLSTMKVKSSSITGLESFMVIPAVFILIIIRKMKRSN